MDFDKLLFADKLDEDHQEETAVVNPSTEGKSSQNLEANNVQANKKYGKPAGPSKVYKEKIRAPAHKLTERQQKLKEKLDSAEELEYTGSGTSRNSFSKEDKKIVAKALNTFGYNDLRLIKKMLPSKKMAEIENYLNFCRHKGMSLPYTRNYFRRIKKLANVDSWISAFQSTRSRLVSDELVMAIEEIAKNERHPPPSSCGGVDFKKMYNYLAEVCRGDIPTEMPAQNYALLKTSFNLLQDYKEHLPLTAALHKDIFKRENLEIPNFEKNRIFKTYQGKEKAISKNADDEEYKYQYNPLQMNCDLLIMDSNDVDKLRSTAEFANAIPTRRRKSDKIYFQPDGLPVQRDLILTALRAEERPVRNVIRCNGSDLYIKMPYATTEDLKRVHYNSEDASPHPLNSLTFKIDSQSANLMTTVLPEAIVDKRCRINSREKPYLLNIQDSHSYYTKPKLVTSIPFKPSVTEIRYDLKADFVDPFLVKFVFDKKGREPSPAKSDSASCDEFEEEDDK